MPSENLGQTVAYARIRMPISMTNGRRFKARPKYRQFQHIPLPGAEKYTPQAGVERHLRLDLRVLLNQGDGTWMETNAIADELAYHILRTFTVTEKETS